MTTKLLNWADSLLMLGFPLLSLVLTIWATFTPGNSPIGLGIAWIVTASLIAGGAAATVRKMNAARLVKFYSPRFGISVGWTKDEYEVTLGAFDGAVDALLFKVDGKYPSAKNVLKGCLVVFTEPKYQQDSTGRQVAGEQDGPIIIVGWRNPLRDSALAHELCHRVLQLCAGDPPELEAHRLMRELGVA